MRVLVWIVEGTWKAAVAAAKRFVPADAQIALLHIAPAEAQAVAREAPQALLGRRHAQSTGVLQSIAAQVASGLLADARACSGATPRSRCAARARWRGSGSGSADDGPVGNRTRLRPRGRGTAQLRVLPPAMCSITHPVQCYSSGPTKPTPLESRKNRVQRDNALRRTTSARN